MKPTRKRPSARTTASAVSHLMDQARNAAARVPDPLAELATAIKATQQTEADPYVMLGVLLEGAIQTLLQRIPKERQAGAISAALVLFSQRLAQNGEPPFRLNPCETHSNLN